MPYLYSEQDIVRLMQSARALPAEWWALTVETAIGLLAVTGMRVGEVGSALISATSTGSRP